MQEFVQSYQLWIKAFHIIFVVCWFAGIFYLPRLMVNHVMSDNAAVRQQLTIMEGKLYRFITPFAILTVILGALLLMGNWDYYRQATWLWIKIALVALLLIYHCACGYYLRRLREDSPVPGHVFFRAFNEFPVLLLFAIVLLVELQPV